MNIIEETLINNLEKFNLIGKKLVIGFSGGGDSTSLIIALNELRGKNSKLNFNIDNPIFIIDPYGRAVMYFNPGTDPKLILKDLKVLI